MDNNQVKVIGGVDTHSDEHVAAVVDDVGRILGTASFPVSSAGYQQLFGWMNSFGVIERVGIEGTGSYGAGLARYLASVAGVDVIEVNRPNRQLRRRRGKSDVTDAEAAARSALNGEARGTPKSGDGPVEAIRVLQVTRRSAVKAKTQAANQVRAIVVSAPEPIRARLFGLKTAQRIKVCARFRPGESTDPTSAIKRALRMLAVRYQSLHAEIVELDAAIATLCATTNPALLGATGIGSEVAATLLIAAGDNPARMRTEGSFAALCGASPVEASSGRTVRHRLNQGGNRQANNALWRIAFIRLSCDERTQQYAARRREEGKSDREIMRCLKRYIAREVYRLLVNPPATIDAASLRRQRCELSISLEHAADQLGTWSTRLSGLERGLIHDTNLATKYQSWLAVESQRLGVVASRSEEGRALKAGLALSTHG